jgi:hypothetical protein
MKLDRTVTKLTTIKESEDHGYMPGTPAERVNIVWDITVALWSISTRGQINAESRLQRNVAMFREAQR